jgi:hypothetical protein
MSTTSLFDKELRLPEKRSKTATTSLSFWLHFEKLWEIVMTTKDMSLDCLRAVFKFS